jgi:hypothetical protein
MENKLKASVQSTLMMTMSMGWDYVPELGPPTGLFFIPQVIACMSMGSHGEMILTGEISWFVHQSSLAILPAESSSNKATEMITLAFEISFFHTSKWFHKCRKILRPRALRLLRRKMCCGYLSPLKIHRLGRSWTGEHWTSMLIAIPVIFNRGYAYPRGYANTS